MNNNKNPFLVPDAYFDNLPKKVMQRIKTNEVIAAPKKVTSWNKRPIFQLVAASLTGIFIISGVILYRHALPTTLLPENNNFFSLTDMEYSDEDLDYLMLDNSDIEYYLTVAE